MSFLISVFIVLVTMWLTLKRPSCYARKFGSWGSINRSSSLKQSTCNNWMYRVFLMLQLFHANSGFTTQERKTEAIQWEAELSLCYLSVLGMCVHSALHKLCVLCFSSDLAWCVLKHVLHWRIMDHIYGFLTIKKTYWASTADMLSALVFEPINKLVWILFSKRKF